jgi:hypothetical protein
MNLVPNTIIQIFLKVSPTASIRDFPLFVENRILWRNYAELKGFKYIYLYDENIAEFLGEYKDFYYSLRYNWNRIDFLRYLVLNKIGGIYIDLDVEPDFDRDLFDLLNRDFIIGKFLNKKSNWENCNSILGCRKGQLDDLINFSITQYNEKSNMEVYKCRKVRFMLNTTGNQMFKKWCKNNGCNFTPEIHDYLTDHFSATWLKKDFA